KAISTARTSSMRAARSKLSAASIVAVETGSSSAIATPTLRQLIGFSPEGRKDGLPPSRHRDVLRQIDVLDGVEQLDALLHRALECLAAADQPHAAAALVDDRRAHRLGEVALAGRGAAA